jgi:hypothetical protein
MPTAAFAVTAPVVLLVAVGVVALRTSEARPRVVLIGDSLTTVSAAPLTDRLGEDRDVEIIAVPGSRADQMAPYVDEKVSGTPEVVVVNLGTNDLLSGSFSDATVQALRSLLQRFPDSCRRIVTMNEAMFSEANPDIGAEAAMLNGQIEGLAAETGSTVVQWDRAVEKAHAQGEPAGPLLSDTVHPTEIGQQHLADLYLEAVDSC